MKKLLRAPRALLLSWASCVGLSAATFDVRAYGAKADATTNDAPAIQAAIDACAIAGGGTVLVPAGNYLTGMIRFRSHVTMRLENGALLQASRRREDYPIFVDVEQRTDRSRVGAVREMTFRDIHIRSDNAILLQGMPESPLRNITLQNVVFTVDRDFDFAKRQKAQGGSGNPKDKRITLYARQPSYVTLAHIEGLFVDNVLVQIDDNVFVQHPRSAIGVFESTRVRLQNIGRLPAGRDDGEPVLTLENCQRAVVTGRTAEPATPVFLGVRGARSGDILLAGNFLARAAKPIVQTAEVKPGTVVAP